LAWGDEIDSENVEIDDKDCIFTAHVLPDDTPLLALGLYSPSSWIYPTII
jgi:hypothetical protein